MRRTLRNTHVAGNGPNRVRIALLAIVFVLIASIATMPVHRTEGAVLNVKVLVAAGITSNSDDAKTLRDSIRTALGGGLIDLNDINFVSYSNSSSDSSVYDEPYTREATCKGVDGLETNISQALAADASSKFILIGHSLGGFAISKWASESDLSRVGAIITLDSPLDLNSFTVQGLAQSRFDKQFKCSVREGDAEKPGALKCPDSDSRCNTLEQLVDENIFRNIRGVPSRVPFATFDCTGGGCLSSVFFGADFAVYTDLPDTWRHWRKINSSTGHDLWKLPDVQAKIADTARTSLIEVGETSVGALCPTNWSANPNGAWIEGWACETKETSSYSVNVPDAGSIAVVYSGSMSPTAILKYPSGITQSMVLNGESTCPRFEYHDAGFLGKTLCRKFLGTLTAAGPYTVEFKTTKKCTLVFCDNFILDGIETTPRQLSTAANAVDTILIIDSSGSMSWNDAQNKRLDAGKAYLTASLAGDFVGVVDFDDSVRLAGSLQRLPDAKPNLVNSINSIDSSGGTNIGIGVQLACDTLLGATSGNTRKAAILLTDGDGAFGTQDECFRSRGWPIFTFGFGSADDVLLQRIATNTGGQFARLPTSNIVCEFQRVRQLIAGSAPGDCTSKSVLPNATISFAATVGPQQSQATFSTSWLGSDVAMSLVSPSGRIIERSTVAPDVIHDLGSSFESYSIILPESGDWEVRLFGLSVPPSGEDVIFNVISIPQPADGTPPVTNIALNPETPGIGGTYGQSVEVTLVALDPDLGDSSLISGVSSVHYELDGGGVQTYRNPITVSAAGSHAVRYWSVDSAGNTEPGNDAQFTIASATLTPQPLRTHTPVPPTPAPPTPVPPTATVAVATPAAVQPTPTLVRAVAGVVRPPDTGSGPSASPNVDELALAMAIAGIGLGVAGANLARRQRPER